MTLILVALLVTPTFDCNLFRPQLLCVSEAERLKS